MNRYIWPSLFIACALGVALNLPYGQEFDPFSLDWFVADACAFGMIVFVALWMWDGRWGG